MSIWPAAAESSSEEWAYPMSVWLAIRYRDFYDYPRAVVVDWNWSLYLFDCPFDIEADNYPDEYEVFKLPEHLRPDIDEMSWTDLSHLGSRVGTVPIAAVQFDETRRRLMNTDVFHLLTTMESSPPEEADQS